MKKWAAEVDGETVIITFDPHPRTVINAASGIRLINTLDEKIELLSGKGIDHLVVIPFTENLPQLTAEEYISQFLIRYFQPHTLIIGYDHRFGKGRTGNYELLKQQSVVYQLPSAGNSCPSTEFHFREFHPYPGSHKAGDMETARNLLGYIIFSLVKWWKEINWAAPSDIRQPTWRLR